MFGFCLFLSVHLKLLPDITHYKIFKWEYYVRCSITSRYCSFTNLRNGGNTKFKFSPSNGNPFWWILPKLTLVNSHSKFPYINSPDFFLVNVAMSFFVLGLRLNATAAEFKREQDFPLVSNTRLWKNSVFEKTLSKYHLETSDDVTKVFRNSIYPFYWSRFCSAVLFCLKLVP